MVDPRRSRTAELLEDAAGDAPRIMELGMVGATVGVVPIEIEPLAIEITPILIAFASGSAPRHPDHAAISAAAVARRRYKPAMKPTSFRIEQSALDDLETVRGWLQRRSAGRVSQADALTWVLNRAVDMLPELERQEAEAAAKPPAVERQPKSDRQELEEEVAEMQERAQAMPHGRERTDLMNKIAALKAIMAPRPNRWRS